MDVADVLDAAADYLEDIVVEVWSDERFEWYRPNKWRAQARRHDNGQIVVATYGEQLFTLVPQFLRWVAGEVPERPIEVGDTVRLAKYDEAFEPATVIAIDGDDVWVRWPYGHGLYLLTELKRVEGS